MLGRREQVEGASKAKKGGKVASTCASWGEWTGARIELGMGWRLGPVVGPAGSGWESFVRWGEMRVGAI